MSDSENPTAEEPTDDELARIDAVCHDFVRRLLDDTQTPIADFVDRVPESIRQRLLTRLIQEHAEFVRRIGRTPTPADYPGSSEFALLRLSRAGVFDGDVSGTPCPTTVQGPPSGTPSGATPTLEPVGSDEYSTGRERPSENESAGPRPSGPPALAAGDEVGRFRLVSFLGRGGFGDVWRAHDPRLDRDVALKVVRPDVAFNAEAARRLRHEARRQAALRDVPGVVLVHEADEVDGRWYIVSQLVEGGTLETRLPDLSREERLRIVADVARILHGAHERRIVHRDVKPANILLDAGNRPYVTDFGIAATERELLDEPRRLVVGTYSYMPPEQIDGRSNDVDPRADVYALGAILYEMLVNRRPFQATDLRTLQRMIVERRPWPPRSLDPSIHPRLERVCLRCLAKDPADRYSSAADVAAELARFPNRPMRRGWLIAACAALAVVAGGIVVGRLGSSGSGGEAKPFSESPVEPTERRAEWSPWRELFLSDEGFEFHHPPGAVFRLHVAARELVLDDDSRDGTYLRIGHCESADYRLRLSMERHGRPLMWGVFLGGRADENVQLGPHLRLERFHMVDTGGDVELRHAIDRIVPAGRPHSLFVGEDDVRTGGGTQLWILTVEGGRLERIEVDGVSVWRRELHGRADVTQLDHRGGFGLFVREGGIAVRNARIAVGQLPSGSTR